MEGLIKPDKPGWPHLQDMKEVEYTKHFALLLCAFISKSKQVHNSYTFFYKKKVYKKMRLKWLKSQENLKKITSLNFENEEFLLAKNQYFVISAFKILKMEFKFEYAILITKA